MFEKDKALTLGGAADNIMQIEAAIEFRTERLRAKPNYFELSNNEHFRADVHSEDIPFEDELYLSRRSNVSGQRPTPRISENESPLTSERRITATPFTLRDPKAIRPREWIYGGHYIRSFISATVAAGGIGKSSLLLTEAVIMATGKALLHHPVQEPVRVWYWCGEDPREEIERRLHAICLHFGITAEDLSGRLFIDSGRDTEIKIAVSERQGFKLATPVIEDMIAEIRVNKIDVLILDPMVSTHSVSENDNMAIDAVAKSWGYIAGAANCSIELAHHIRKTGGEASVDDARGASALKDAARSVRVLNKMTKVEAENAGVTSDSRFFFRVDYGDKANMRPPSESSEWHQMVGVKLGNGIEGLSGDNVGVPTKWLIPTLFDNLSKEDCRKALEAIGNCENRKSPQSPQWAGHAVGRALGIDTTSRSGKNRVNKILEQWLKNGILKLDEVTDKKSNSRPIYVVVSSNEYAAGQASSPSSPPAGNGVDECGT